MYSCNTCNSPFIILLVWPRASKNLGTALGERGASGGNWLTREQRRSRRQTFRQRAGPRHTKMFTTKVRGERKNGITQPCYENLYNLVHASVPVHLARTREFPVQTDHVNARQY